MVTGPVRMPFIGLGSECHPCCQWLLKLVSPYLAAWPEVDLDVRQEFQFGGVGARFGHEIDLLVTPDPLYETGLRLEPVLDGEQVLVVGPGHPLGKAPLVQPEQLARETLITHPVAIDRLGIYIQLLLPAGIRPKRHKPIETTDIMLRMVASGCGVAALPRWLVDEVAAKLPPMAVRLGALGIAKQIFLGIRAADAETDDLSAFVALARAHREPKRETARGR
ncbi:hypothetical protein G3446_11485 [Thiorhodococcus minor]|uniref:LysR substrate-binding domain-containing protein n=1 Tax=Thiorhodococcus minor TaxID=57489 RepID=A0A6M0K2D8_9GAMM|nr:hypothetical protein [Thiorhodococcus minor]